jgi:hypothetical protein
MFINQDGYFLKVRNSFNLIICLYAGTGILNLCMHGLSSDLRQVKFFRSMLQFGGVRITYFVHGKKLVLSRYFCCVRFVLPSPFL